MQFSLKWILVAVVYVAIAAAAFSQQSWVYADILWGVSLLAIVFAALLAFMGRGKGRVAAAGFLLAGLAYVACVAFGRFTGSDVVPTRRWLKTAGYDPNSAAYTLMASSPMPQPGTFQSGGAVFFPATPAAPSPNALSLSFTPSAVPVPLPTAPLADFGIYVRAANAVSLMLFGGLGAVVGLLAFKRISEPTPNGH